MRIILIIMTSTSNIFYLSDVLILRWYLEWQHHLQLSRSLCSFLQRSAHNQRGYFFAYYERSSVEYILGVLFLRVTRKDETWGILWVHEFALQIGQSHQIVQHRALQIIRDHLQSGGQLHSSGRISHFVKLQYMPQWGDLLYWWMGELYS